MFNFFKKFFYKKTLEKVNPPKIMSEEQEKKNSSPQVQGALPSEMLSEKQVEEQKWQHQVDEVCGTLPSGIPSEKELEEQKWLLAMRYRSRHWHLL
ncbi:MAG: hypothetical protein OXC82_11485 [Rhodobacteraceae bacterium]|nr:hypothetical protein [Paracoccaceae bacterium]MCY4251039.1 hypothetical protein [Paracoccaceae bacterium]